MHSSRQRSLSDSLAAMDTHTPGRSVGPSPGMHEVLTGQTSRMIQQRPLLQTALLCCNIIRDIQQSRNRRGWEVLQLGGISYLQVLESWVWPATRHAQKTALESEIFLKEKRLQEKITITRPSDLSPGSLHWGEGSSDLSPSRKEPSSPIIVISSDSSGETAEPKMRP
eukprot:4875105-Amphidinium_carterae.2